ncbi:hypothetical protein BC938DRAFT_479876, partial [Jimgerdemannia flammicorona]
MRNFRGGSQRIRVNKHARRLAILQTRVVSPPPSHRIPCPFTTDTHIHMPPPHPLRPHAVPTVAYFRACQSSLNRRIIDVAAVLLMFVYGLVLLFQARLGIFGNIYNIVSFKTIFYTITIYVPLALLVIARKALMTVERSVQPSLLMSIFAHLADARTWTLLGLYMLSGLVIGVSYFSMHGEKYVKSVFLYPE